MPDNQRTSSILSGTLSEMQQRYSESSSVFKSSVGELKKLACSVKSELASAKLQVRQQASQLKEKSQRLNDLQKQLNLEEEGKLCLDQEIQRLTSKLSKADEQAMGLRADVCQLEGKFAEIANLCSEQKQQLISYEHEVKSLEKELHKCLNDKQSLEIKFETSKAETERIQKDCNDKICQLNKELSDIKSKMLDVSTHEETLNGEKDTLRQALSEAEEKLDKVDRDLSVQAAKCCKLRVQKKKYKEISERFQHRCAELEKKFVSWTKFQEDIAKAKADYQQKCADIAVMEKSLSDHVANLKVEGEKNSQLLKEKEFFKGKLFKEKDERQRLAQASDLISQELESVRKSMQVLETEKFNVTQSRDKLGLELRTVIKQLDEELQTSRADLKSARQSVAALTQENTDLHFTVRELNRRGKEQGAALQQSRSTEARVQEQSKSLEGELLLAKEKLKDCLCRKKGAKDQSNVDTSLLRMLTDLKISRIETERLTPQDDTEDQTKRIFELEGKLRNEEMNRKVDQLEKHRLSEQIKLMKDAAADSGISKRLLQTGKTA